MSDHEERESQCDKVEQNRQNCDGAAIVVCHKLCR